MDRLFPVNSLKVSLDASVQAIRAHEPQAIELFCLLGMLPSGIKTKDLEQLWSPGKKEFGFLAEVLKKHSLLVEQIEPDGSSKIMLSVPLMVKYAESLLLAKEFAFFQL